MTSNKLNVKWWHWAIVHYLWTESKIDQLERKLWMTNLNENYAQCYKFVNKWMDHGNSSQNDVSNYEYWYFLDNSKCISESTHSFLQNDVCYILSYNHVDTPILMPLFLVLTHNRARNFKCESFAPKTTINIKYNVNNGKITFNIWVF